MASTPPPFTSTKETTNYAHLCRLLVDVGTQALRDTFDFYWVQISNALVGLGGKKSNYGAIIDQLKTEDMDPDIEEHYQELLKKWKKEDDSIKDKVRKIEGTNN